MDLKFENDLIKHAVFSHKVTSTDGRMRFATNIQCKFLFTEILPKPFFDADMYPQDSFKSEMNLIRKIFFCSVYVWNILQRESKSKFLISMSFKSISQDI